MKILQQPVGSMAVFSYLVIDEDSGAAIIIDPAGDEERLARLISEQGVNLRYIVNTHGHADHTCGNEPLRKRLGTTVPVVMHEQDDDFFQQPENQAFARAMGFMPAPPADVRIRDDERMAFGNLSMRFIHTPGHTPGSCCILVKDHLFTGDTLFVGAVGRTDLPGASFPRLLESLKRIIALPGQTIICPGHDYGDRPLSTVERETQTNPYITDFLLQEE